MLSFLFKINMLKLNSYPSLVYIKREKDASPNGTLYEKHSNVYIIYIENICKTDFW